MSIFEKGAALLAKVKRAHGSEIKYRRRGDEITLIALLGEDDLDELTEGALTATVQRRPFLVVASDLVVGGEEILPEEGDTIEVTIEGKTFVYEVALGLDGKVWSYQESTHRHLRIHTWLREIS